jgi:phosphoribosylformimino-5-aminoimidazole carboxamide ribotide isomerase
MIIYPAIDIMGRRCVRLKKGVYEDADVYFENPVDAALKWRDEGSKYLHIVDLDGARYKKPQCMDIVFEIYEKTGLFIEIGGGIRDFETASAYLDGGISRVIFGTSAITALGEIEKTAAKYPGKTAVGIDAKDGFAAMDGWLETSKIHASELAKKAESAGADTVIYTDIATDGMLSGPNLKAMEEMKKTVSINVIASGGVSRIEDLVSLKNAGVDGVIVGKALYTGNVNLKEALALI